MRRVAWLAFLVAATACGASGGSDDDVVAIDAAVDASSGDAVLDAATDAALDAASSDASSDGPAVDGNSTDASTIDTATIDATTIDATVIDAPTTDAPSIDAQSIDAPSGPITGGPCLSGAAGQTAYRIRWTNGGSGSSAYVVYEVHAMPNTSRFRAGAYGYTIPFTPQYVDTALAQGGVLLNSSDFIDIELSTVGISSISSATLALYGRSYNTTTSGSFNWMTFDGFNQTPTNFVSNSAPYAYYAASMTTEISPNDNGVLIRIKAGPSSGSLVVNRIEICMQAT
jgi:hypothetical protein